MKNLIRRLILCAFTFFLILPLRHSQATVSNEQLESCYDKLLAVDETKTGENTSTHELLSEDQRLDRCNKAVIHEAESEKNVDNVLTLANIVGRKSNWISAAPVYVIAAKLDQKKACNDEKVIASTKDGLAHPSDYAPVKGTLKLMEACFPQNKEMLSHQVTAANDSYTAKNLCPFLNSKKVSLSKISKTICDKVQK